MLHWNPSVLTPVEPVGQSNVRIEAFSAVY